MSTVNARAMNTVSTAFGDSSIMLRRNLKHTLRNPITVFNGILLPVLIMLMFVYVLGGAFAVGEKYVDYATPGMIVMAISYGLSATATEVNDDMTKGIINRFKVMDVSRGSVLTGHVIITTVRCLVAGAAVTGVALAIGFRPSASALDWLGAIGLVVLLSFATGWLTIAMGLIAKTPASKAALSCRPTSCMAAPRHSRRASRSSRARWETSSLLAWPARTRRSNRTASTASGCTISR
jgi:ABC-2 type transport system permease protein